MPYVLARVRQIEVDLHHGSPSNVAGTRLLCAPELGGVSSVKPSGGLRNPALKPKSLAAIAVGGVSAVEDARRVGGFGVRSPARRNWNYCDSSDEGECQEEQGH